MTSKSKFATNWICVLLAGTLHCSGTLLAQTTEKPKRSLLFIGQAKGYQHEAISTAMATLYNLGRSSGLWNTQLRTDCTAITKKPLRWEAKNLDAFDAIVFFTDGDLDMDASQKADLLSFVRDDGKGFIGIHSAAITFTSWPEYGQMLGGYFDGHPWGQFNAPLVVEDATFPGMNNIPAAFTVFDEIYQIKDFSRQNVRVLLSLDAERIDLSRKGEACEQGFRRGLGEELRQRPRALQRPRARASCVGASRCSKDVAGDGAVVDGVDSRRCHTIADAAEMNHQCHRR